MNISESVRLLKALADASRIKIIHSLFEKAQYVEEIAERHDLATSTVSFHLKKLEEADLVYKVKEQYYLVYHVKKKLFDLTLKDLISIKDSPKAIQEERIAQYKKKVIDSFFKDGKLTKIPSQHKKRWVVYEKILEKFTLNKKYTEPEVNAIIEEIHEDYCTIRREFIGENVMQRDKNHYWIVKNKFTEEVTETQTKRGLKKSFTESNLDKTDGEKEKNKILKRQGKTKEKFIGVFKIENRKNQRVLFDSSKNIHAAINRHKAELKFGTHRNKGLQDDWNLQKPDDFLFEIVELVKPEEHVEKGLKVSLKERCSAYREECTHNCY